MTVGALYRQYLGKINLTLFLLTFERVIGVAFPFVLGVAINELIAGSYRGVILLAALEVSEITIGVIRRLYDTRVYARIYTEVANRTARKTDIPVSQRSARLGLARELVDFFEWMLPELLASVIAVIGALAMLFYLLPVVGGISIIACLLIGGVFALSSRRIFALNKLLNNELERQVSMLESNQPLPRRRHFGRLARWRIHLSDLEAANFGVADIVLSGLIIGALLLTVKTGLSVGETFSILTYVLDVVAGMLVLPWTYQQWIRVREISGRITAE